MLDLIDLVFNIKIIKAQSIRIGLFFMSITYQSMNERVFIVFKFNSLKKLRDEY